MCLGLDPKGKVTLSMKALIEKPAAPAEGCSIRTRTNHRNNVIQVSMIYKKGCLNKVAFYVHGTAHYREQIDDLNKTETIYSGPSKETC